MTRDEQILICKAIAKMAMWGRGDGCLPQDLDKILPMTPSWQETYAAHKREAEHEHAGVVKDEEEVRFWLARGYRLTNYSPGEMMLFNPPPMGGLSKYLVGELAEKYGPIYDAHNFAVYKHRAAERRGADT